LGVEHSGGQPATRAGLSRREIIKRSAVAGGLVWTAPVVIDSLASPAGALSVCTSTACSTTTPSHSCTWYGFRIVANATSCSAFGGNLDKCPNVDNFWSTLTNPSNGFTTVSGCPPGTVITSSSVSNITFTLPSNCNVAIGTVFAGNDCCYFGAPAAGSCTTSVGMCAGHGISHVDVIVCCCPPA
jgi:hypothetical protein